jgi:hypothetical protein
MGQYDWRRLFSSAVLLLYVIACGGSTPPSRDASVPGMYHLSAIAGIAVPATVRGIQTVSSTMVLRSGYHYTRTDSDSVDFRTYKTPLIQVDSGGWAVRNDTIFFSLNVNQCCYVGKIVSTSQIDIDRLGLAWTYQRQ